MWGLRVLAPTVLKNMCLTFVVVAQSSSHVWLCSPMEYSTPGFPAPHHLTEFAQVHVHCICDAIQPSHPLTPSSPSVLSLSQLQGLFQWVSYSYQMTKILELHLQHQSFQWIISLKIDCFDLLAVQGTFGSLLQHHGLKASILWCSVFSTVQLSQLYVTTGKIIQTFDGRIMSLLFKSV